MPGTPSHCTLLPCVCPVLQRTVSRTSQGLPHIVLMSYCPTEDSKTITMCLSCPTVLQRTVSRDFNLFRDNVSNDHVSCLTILLSKSVRLYRFEIKVSMTGDYSRKFARCNSRVL